MCNPIKFSKRFLLLCYFLLWMLNNPRPVLTLSILLDIQLTHTESGPGAVYLEPCVQLPRDIHSSAFYLPAMPFRNKSNKVLSHLEVSSGGTEAGHGSLSHTSIPRQLKLSKIYTRLKKHSTADFKIFLLIICIIILRCSEWILLGFQCSPLPWIALAMLPKINVSC